MINNKTIYMIEHLGLLYISHIHTHTQCVPNVTLASIEFSHTRSIKLTFNCLLYSNSNKAHSITSIDFPNFFSI